MKRVFRVAIIVVFLMCLITGYNVGSDLWLNFEPQQTMSWEDCQ